MKFILVCFCLLLSFSASASDDEVLWDKPDFTTQQFKDWILTQPEYFQKISRNGKHHQKEALLAHYNVAEKHQGVYSIPQGKDGVLNAISVWSTGIRAFSEKEDYAEAFYYLGALAAWDRATPYYYSLAAMALYAGGHEDRGFLWDYKAAEKGYASSQATVGLSYFHGNRMVEQDNELALKYLLSASEQGNCMAQRYLALFYSYKTRHYSLEKLYYYSMLSALQGDAYGQSLYSACYEDGLFVPKNYFEAYKWACIAHSNEARPVGNAIKRLEARLTKQQIYQAQQEASRQIEIIRAIPSRKFNIIIMYDPDMGLTHVSYTKLPTTQYLQIMSLIHDIKYTALASIETNRQERLYSDIKIVLSKYSHGAAQYIIKKDVLKKQIGMVLSENEQPVYY